MTNRKWEPIPDDRASRGKVSLPMKLVGMRRMQESEDEWRDLKELYKNEEDQYSIELQNPRFHCN